MDRLKTGFLAGLIAVAFTTAVNVAGRLLGWLPEPMDMKYMAEFIIDPVRFPTVAFWLGLLVHILLGGVIGALYGRIMRPWNPITGMVFMVFDWLVMMLVLFPLTGRGFWGLDAGPTMAASTFVLNMLYGIAVGWIAPTLGDQRKEPSWQEVQVKYEAQIGNALDKALKQSRAVTIDLASTRYIIFSDHHKGIRNNADDFQVAEQAYNAALAYYFKMGHTLIVLGDVEELWEEEASAVLDAYEYTLKLEAMFHQAKDEKGRGRYLRFWGNHDSDWKDAPPEPSDWSGRLLRWIKETVFKLENAKERLDKIYGAPPLAVYETLIMNVMEGGEELGALFLAHGHQGTGDSDRWAWLSRLGVRHIWRRVQELIGVSLNIPSKNWQLREKHNLAMYHWAEKQNRLILIAGHTHRPVFLSRSHPAKIIELLNKYETQPKDKQPRPQVSFLTAKLEAEQVSLLAAELEWVRSQEHQAPGDEGDKAESGKLKECYYNTGCCSFIDGEITGIEIADGEIRLVRWPDDSGRPRPRILESAKLRQVFESFRVKERRPE